MILVVVEISILRLAMDGVFVVMQDGIKNKGSEYQGGSTHDDHKGFIWTDCHCSLLPV